jgi:hypothetical protein
VKGGVTMGMSLMLLLLLLILIAIVFATNTGHHHHRRHRRRRRRHRRLLHHCSPERTAHVFTITAQPTHSTQLAPITTSTSPPTRHFRLTWASILPTNTRMTPLPSGGQSFNEGRHRDTTGDRFDSG